MDHLNFMDYNDLLLQKVHNTKQKNAMQSTMRAIQILR